MTPHGRAVETAGPAGNARRPAGELRTLRRSCGSHGSAAPGAAGPSFPGRPAGARELARLYARLPAAPDIGFWRRLATAAGGPILYLGCGAGRLAIPLARAGVEVWGIETSAAMLGAFARRLAGEPLPVRRRLHLLKGDAQRVTLERRFPLVIAPSHLLNSCLEPDSLQEVLASTRAHLARGGRFACQVLNPYWLAVGAAAGGQLPADAPGGRPVRVRMEPLRYDPWTQRYRGRATYWLPADAGGPAEQIIHEFDAAAIFPRELEKALASARLAPLARLGGTGRGRPQLAESSFYVVCGPA